MSVGSQPFDVYVVHVHLYRAEDDDPPPGMSVMTHVRVWRTDDAQDDEARAEAAALKNLRPYLNNSTHIKTLAVLT